tara:strand:+ start:382 stop:642 length:261 start_codon:yes stop_codon:yes gene_type:complete
MFQDGTLQPWHLSNLSEDVHTTFNEVAKAIYYVLPEQYRTTYAYHVLSFYAEYYGLQMEVTDEERECAQRGIQDYRAGILDRFNRA